MAGNESFDLGLGRRERQPVTERLADIQRGAPLAGEPPKPKTIQDISLETGVPWNVIETVVQDSGVAPEQSLVLAQDFAQKMKQEIDAGRDIPSAMRSIFGDDAPIEDALERAVALAGRGDEGRASSGQNNDNSFAEDFGRSVAGGAITGVGMIAEGAGTLLDVDDLFGDPGYTDFLEDAGRAVAGTLQGWGQNVKDGMSDDAKRAIRNSTPKGKIFEPSTWEFEGDVSPKGIALLTADVLGSLAPVVIAGAFTGGVGGAVVGGLQGAGAGSQTGREIVNRASHEQLKESSGYYNELIAKGMKPKEAKEKVADAAGSLAAVFAAPVAGAGGAITGRMVQKGLPGLASKGLGTRVAGTAAVGALEEGVQEATEGYVARAGAELASGLPVDKMEGTFGEFVLGALGGGAFGAGRGLLPSRQEDQGDGTGEPLALPPPDPQLPPPDGGTGGSDPTARPPLGNLARAAQAAPKPVEPDAPRPTLNAQAGQSVRVVLGNGMQVDAEFVGEDEAGVSLKVNGEAALITRERMERDGIQIEPVDVIGETAWADVETSPTVNFEPLDDTTEPPAKRAERLSGALDTYLSEQKIDTTPQDRAEIANSIDRFGGTVEQAVADFMAEMTMEALAQESAAIAPVPQPGEAVDQEPVKSETPVNQGGSDVSPAQNQQPVKKLDGTAWGAMAPEQRQALLASVGFKDAQGNLNAPGRRAAGKEWDALSERVREKLAEQIDPQAQAGAPVAPVADPNRGLRQSNALTIEAPEERPTRTQPGVNVLPDGEEPIAMPGSVASAATETEEQPTEGQKEAENYRTGKADWMGLKLSVENRKGAERSKKTPDGKTEWSVTMPAHYGRILRTKGADGDHVDFYMGDNEASENVWVIDQMDAETGRFDEHKTMLGFDDAAQAGETYRAGFSDGKGAQRLGGIKKMTVADFKAWLADGDTTKPVTPKATRDDKDAQSRQDAPDTSEGGDLNAGIRNAEAEGQGGQEEVNSAPEQGVGEETSPTQDATARGVEAINKAVLPENKDGTGFYVSGGTEIQIDDLGNGDAEITITRSKSRYSGKQKITKEKAQKLRFSDVRDQLSDQVRAVVEAEIESTATPPETTGPRTKIEDFGEKIGGARKDKAAAWTEDLGRSMDLGSMTLTEAFPKPDLEALLAGGNSMEVVTAVAAIRGAIPRKPSRGWRVASWAEDVESARALAKGLLDGELSLADIDAAKGRMSRAGHKLTTTINAFAQLPLDIMDAAAASYTIEPVYQFNTNDVAYFQLKRHGEWRAQEQADTIEALLPKITSRIEAERESKKGRGTSGGRKPVELGVYKRKSEGAHFIGFKVSQVVKLVGGFPTANAARAYLKENEEGLQAQADLMRDGLNERGGMNRERKGPAHRDGDVTPEMFTEAFGFRGVEFGNWNNQSERQKNLNSAYDALMDLAGALGVPSRAVSLDGTLAIAFGARGRGGKNPAAAHYEPDRIVMNLTKKSGAGSLAHEWFHAFDHYLARKDSEKGSRIGVERTSETASVRKEFMSDRAQLLKADSLYNELTLALKRPHEWYKRSEEADRARSKPYFATTIELAARGFEKHVIDTLARRGMLNDYLANIDGMSGAYPSTREMRRDALRTAFDTFISAGIADMGAQEGVTPKLPEPDDALLFDGPDTGETWDAPEGRYKIVERDGGTYTVMAPSGATEIYDGPEAIEALMKEAQQALDGEKAAKDGDAATKRERDAALRERAKQIASDYRRDSGKPTDLLSKSYRFPDGVYSRLEKIVQLLEDGWTIAGQGNARNIVSPNGTSFGPGTWTRQGIAFAGWYALTLENRRRIEESASQNAEPDTPDAEGMSAADALAQAMREEFGDEAGRPASPSDPSKRKQPSGAQDARTAGEAGRDAVRNAAEGADAALEGLMKLFGGKDMLNSGFVFSDETYQAAKPLFKQAITKFADAGSDVLQMARALIRELKGRGMSAEAITDMMPYLERFIEEEQGLAIETEVLADQEAVPAADEYAAFRSVVADHMRDGGGYGDIRSLRKQAGEALGRRVEPADHKAIEEAAEEAIVGLARDIAQGEGTPAEKYDRLVNLYERQPLLAQKTSTSVENQAYSTPAPLAYLASRLAGITSETRVTEPSAGTGMLLIEADPSMVRANEKNPDRVDALRRNLPGAIITQGDATQATYPPYDVLITNPPFGRVKSDGQAVEWPMARTKTSEIDLAIAWRALESMPEEGSAVLILGGVNPIKYQGENRAKGYQGNGKRQFFSNLYKTYNVVDHFTVAGDLYKRQGAGWPVDVVVIRGKGASALPLPMAEAPPMLGSWPDLKGKLDDAETLGTTERQPGVGNPDPAEDVGAGNDTGVVQGAPDGQAGAADTGPRPGRDGNSQGAAVSNPEQPEGSRSRDIGRDGNTRRGDGTGDAGAGRPDADGLSGTGTVDGNAGSRAGGDVAQRPARENTEAETDLQVRYAPRSGARFAVGTLVPRNMQDAISRALDGIEAKHGSIDQFVADALGYSLDELLGTDTKRGAFSAEQVDALAMAIDNVDRGKGFIIGDQTGVGKGRIVAGMLRFAEKKGLVPVFLTKSPGLYGDMIRDLRDIGETDADRGVLVTNDGLRGGKAVPLTAKAGDTLQSPTPAALDDAISHMTQTGRLPEGYRYLFTTYSQMQTVAGKESARRPAMRAIAPNAMFVLDESHEAGGSVGDKGWKKKDAAPDRAEFIREIVRAANGTVFSSATYAKSPEVMSLYSTTDLADAVDKPEDLGAAILKGGVPLQQVTAATLTEAGQYARRERSWEGVEMNLDPVPVDKGLAKKATDIIAAIFDTDVSILSGARKDAVSNLKKEGYATLPGGRAVDVASADQTGFSSVLHNVVSQMLLAIKIDQIADRAAAAHNAGEKPVIAVVNTNGALLSNVIEDEGLAPGAPVSMPFDRILHRYVDRLRRITVKDDNNNTHRIDLSDATLGPTAVAALNRLHDRIRRADLSSLTAAPLDKLKDALAEKGLKVGEITGRSNIIVNGKLTRRDASEAAKKRQMLDFNRGDLDALVINQSGSTGYSLHAIAGAEGNDGKQRRMIVLQPDPNIDTFMQMLGRIHRTGQTSLPKYEIAVSDLAVEKRVAAVLMRKMASLSANTTASKKSAVSLDVTDFLNEVGDKVVQAYLTENWDIAVRLQVDPGEEGVAAKLTGRLALMAPDETQNVYNDLERLYRDEIERLNAIGENPLEAQVVDWKAKPVAKSVVSKGSGTGGAFDMDTVVETLSVRRLGKPHGWEKVEELVGEAKEDLETALNGVQDRLPEAEAAMRERLTGLEEAERAAQETRDSAPARYTKAKAAVQKQREMIQQLRQDAVSFQARLKEFSPGTSVSLTLGEASVPAIVISLDSSAVEGNPLAASKYRVRFAVADAMKEIAMPLSKLGSGDTQVPYEAMSEAMVQSAFLNGATATREQRQVVTGNLINAFAMFERGQVVQFTMEGGEQRYGVALPATFDAQAHLEKMPVQFKNADQIVRYLEAAEVVSTADGGMWFSRTTNGDYKLMAKKGAKQYFSGDRIKQITGEWQARSGPLTVSVTEAQLREAVEYYQSSLSVTFQAETFLDVARGITGETLPDVRPADGNPNVRASRAKPRSTVANLSGNELGEWSDVLQLGKKANKWYRDNLQGQSVTNEETGWTIQFSGAGARKISGRKGEDLLRLVPALREIVSQGRVVATEQDNRGRAEIKAIHKIAARVTLGGAEKDVITTIREAQNGTFYYDLNTDMSDEARFSLSGNDEATGRVGSAQVLDPALEVGLVGLNLEIADGFVKARRADFDAAAGDTITSAPEARKAMRKVRRALRDELAKFGIGTRITLDVREGVIDTFPGLPPMDGYFLDGVIGIAADTPGGYMGVLRHEVIHALRNPQLWGNDYGLFTAQEWRTLVRVARQNTRLMDQVNADYEGLSDTDKIEEVVAEMFREWMETRDTQTALGRAFDKLRQMLDAIVTALRGEGLNDAAAIFDRIRSGDVGGRGPDGPGRGANVTPVKAKIATPRDAGRISVQARNLRAGLSQLASDAVTNAMKDRGGYNTLALVPGRALFNELGKGIPAAKRYLRLKEKMDTKRNDKHAETDVVAQNWRKLTNQNPEANAELMKLMHDSTIAGVDPSERFVSPMGPRDALIIKSGRVANPIAYEAAVERKERHERLQKAHDDLAPRFKALPEGFQKLYRDVRDTYRRLDDEQTAAILGNVERAMTLAIRRAEREHRRVTETARENYAGALRRIGADTALSGTERTTQRAQAKMKLDQAIADADEALAKAKATRSWTKDSQVRKLRAQFETNKLSGPYFPLARFGEYFVLARDDEGNVQSFSRHETVQQQRAAQKDMEDEGFSVQIGVMQETDARDLVDPAFVADIERMLEEVNADEKLMDDIWQRWLESLPDMSIRKHRIHRKNREGYDADALRAFGHHMFHGSHQLARLLYSLEMQEELDVASEEAAASDDPVRKGFIVNEMKRRHGFTMNPKGAWWASRATSLAFVYYLSVSPAAAIVNLSQTSIVGTSVLGRFGGTKKAAGALAKALADFTRSPNWHSERNTKNLSADERQAMHEAYKRGVIDRTQSHDLAQVAESGVEYNAKWVNVMSKISWLFHHSERMNREVTFLAGYRLLREQGKTHDQAITQAGDATWEVHFDYQNCVDGDTEILTTAGWKRYDQVKRGDIAISADDLGRAVETEIEDVNVFNTRQKIKLFTAKGGRNFSMAVTDEHTNMVVQQKKRGGKIFWGEPEMVKTKDLKPSHNILRSPVSPLEREGGEYGIEFARLLGWIAAEGWYAKNRGATQKHSVRIEQSLVHNPDHVDEIQNTLDALGAQYSRHKVKKDRHILWSITGDVNQRVREAMPDKLLTWDMVAKMSAEEMSAVLDAFAKADGTKRGKNACITIEQKRSTNLQNIEVMQAMCACVGKSASIGHGGTRDTSWLMHPGTGRVQNRKTNVGLLNVERVEVPLVWCPTTGTGRWIARRGGHFFITGNTSKPRVMQSPGMQVLLTFRNFSVNFLWRIFRDLHQSVNGADQETRKEARRQAGVMATMMLFHAGIKGVYGYGLVMALMGLFFPDDEDDPEERLEKLMLDYLPRPVARAMLDGVPGTLGGIDLTGRIGMPNLWFRDSLRPLEGADLYQHYVNEVIGPIPAIGMNIATGASRVIDGAALRDGSLVWRGVETAMPKAVRDVMKGGRYAYEGALTYNGDPIKDDFSAWEVIAQVSGFTPKELVDQYDQNGRLKNKERAITDRRRNVIKQAAEQIKAGDPLTPRQLRLIEEFNRDYPEWPITNATLNSSVQGRINRSERNEAGVSVNPRLEPRLRASLSPLVADG